MTPTLTPVAPTAVAPACPRCGALLPLPRPVRAADLRCPGAACGARIRIRGGRLHAA